MTEVEKYVCEKLVQIMHLVDICTSKIHNKKENRLEFIISNFKWVGYHNFTDIMTRLLRHEFGKFEDYFEIGLEEGKENIHDFDLIVIIKLKIDIDTLAGYLRITKGGINA